MWLASTGQRLANPMRQPVELHGGMTDTGRLLYIDVDGKRLHIVERGIRFVIYGEWTQGVNGEARCVRLEDGSYWITVRRLTGGSGWFGERVTSLGDSFSIQDDTQ